MSLSSSNPRTSGNSRVKCADTTEANAAKVVMVVFMLSDWFLRLCCSRKERRRRIDSEMGKNSTLSKMSKF